MNLDDSDLVELFLAPVRKCADYLPAFGRGRTEVPCDLDGFKALYGADPFYSWIGLDDATVFAAHKAAGGLTSVYRQLGVGCERLLRHLLGASLGLSEDSLRWAYEYQQADGTSSVHTLDAHIPIDHIEDPAIASRVSNWVISTQKRLGVPNASDLGGAVLEIRQGYKSADSKRQNADLRFGMKAYQARRLPVFIVLSTQLSLPVVRRYRADGMLVLSGVLTEDPAESTFAFFSQVIGYDLAAFFERNSPTLRAQVTSVTKTLLTP